MHMMMKLSELSSYQKKPLLFTNLNSDTKHESQNVLHFIFKSPPFPLFLCRFDYLSEVKHVGEFPQESPSNENLNVDLMENDSALKFELSAAGLWKLHSHPLGSSDSDRRTTSTTLKKKEQKKPREKVSATHSSNICPSEKLKLILSYLMSLSLMKRLI